MLATWVAQSNQVMVCANAASAVVELLKRHAKIAAKNPETEIERPNPT